MAKDQETGVDPKAKDGEPDGVKSLEEERRRLRDQRDEEQVLGKRGQPIDDQPSDESEPEPELFPLGTVEGDPKITHRNLIKSGMAVKLECALSRAAVPLTGGLYAFGAAGEVLVTFEAGKVGQVPEFHSERQADGSRKVKAVRLVQELSAVHVRSATEMFSLDQVLDLLEREFGVPRSSKKVREVFGLDGPQAAAS